MLTSFSLFYLKLQIFLSQSLKNLETDFLHVSRQRLDIHAFISSVKGEFDFNCDVTRMFDLDVTRILIMTSQEEF